MGLKRLTGLPWVADFRDTWTYDPLDEALQTSAARLRLERALEAMVLRQADRVVAVTDVARNDFMSRFPREARKIRLIPNGFDAASQAPGEARSEREDQRLCVVHTGSFEYSHYLRSPGALLLALKAMQKDHPGLRHRLCVHLIGALSPNEESECAPLVRAGLIECVGPLSAQGAQEWQARADVLLLVDHPRAVLASNVPGKCYEYLCAGKPILALVPEGAARSLILGLGAGLCAPPDDPQKVRGMLEEILSAKRGGQLGKWRASPEQLMRYDRRHLSGEMAQCFDELLGKTSGVG